MAASFAERQLSKHGWKEGDGLGLKEDGIKEAIKVKRKNNMNGLGHDVGEQFTFHWWDHVFNKTASKIKVDDTNKNGVEIKATEEEHVRSTSKYGYLKKSKKLLYGSFVASGTNKDEEKESEESEEEETTEVDEIGTGCSIDTLEKTYKMTGLTGHKAARHGHQLSGKLKRIQDQEQQESMPSPNKAHVDVKRSPSKAHADVNGASDDTELSTEASEKKTKKKKKKKVLNAELSEPVDASTVNSVEDIGEEPVKKKKKKRKLAEIDSTKTVETNLPETVEATPAEPIKKKKKKRNVEPE